METVKTRAKKESSSDHGKRLRKKVVVNSDPIVLGIDLSSTKFAVVATIGDAHVGYRKEKFKTLGELKSHLLDFLDELPSGRYPGRRAYIEEAIVGRGGSRVTIQQSYAMGAVRLTLEEMDWNVSLVNVGTWKKQVVGSGRADKSAVSDWFRATSPELYSLFSGDQDLIDSACIGRFGASSLRTARILDERGSVSGSDTPLLLSTRRRRTSKG